MEKLRWTCDIDHMLGPGELGRQGSIPPIFAELEAKQKTCTAIPYRASTGPEQGFPCVLFLTGKNLLSLQETPVLIAGTLYSLQGILCEKEYTGKSL